MTNILDDLFTVLPELFVLTMACVTMLVALFFSKKSQVAYYLSQLTWVVTIFLVLYVYKQTGSGGVTLSFNGQYVLDVMAVVLKCFICTMVFFSFLYSRAYNNDRNIQSTEYFVLGMLSTLGMLILVSGHSLLTLYLGLELFSLPTFAMVAMYRGSFPATEAAMKYFVISALASGILLYGFSFLFGLTHQLDIAKIAVALAQPELAQLSGLSMITLVLIVAGIVFKLGAAPFQMWVPDVYEGAPTSTTLFIAAAPKIAAFAMVVRLLVFGLPFLKMDWQLLLIAVSILSMALGNLSAIMQSSVKRMLAYSSIAHIGYMLLGFVSGTEVGYAAAMFYIISYGVMTLAGFGTLIILSKKGMEVESLEDLQGLSQRNPWVAFLMLMTMFSMAGIPPLLGFIAKVHIFEALIAAHYVWLVVLALILSVVGAYYYLRVIQQMYFKEPKEEQGIVVKMDGAIAITINSLVILAIGVFPNWLFFFSFESFKLLS
jgi:NADH-quinone oxidoreductase subunit N